MVRRRSQGDRVTGQPEVPGHLRRFTYADWHDDADFVLPAHWAGRGDEWPQLRHIRAFKRFLAARRAWEAETGVHIVRSWEQWAQDRRTGARTLDEVNLPYAPAHFVEPEDPDPRWE